jgi:hypothetical protein
MKLFLILAACLLAADQLTADQNDAYSEGVIPPRLSSWPDRLKDYQELPESRSPDGNFGFIYPKRNVVEKMDDARLYLGQLKPFRILTTLPLQYGNLCENTGSSYSVEWSSDSNGAVFYVGGKKGPFNIFVVSLKQRHAPSVVDLETPIRRLVQSSYEQSNAPRFNDYFDFIFTDGDTVDDLKGGHQEIDSFWNWNDKNQVLVKCICTDDPKRISRPLWEVLFTGTWDVAKQMFVDHHIEQISQDRLPPY